MNTELVKLYTQKIKAHIQQGKQYFIVCEAEHTNNEGSQIIDDLIKDNSLLEEYDVRLISAHKNNTQIRYNMVEELEPQFERIKLPSLDDIIVESERCGFESHDFAKDMLDLIHKQNNLITSDPKSMSKTLLETEGKSRKVLILIENYESLDSDIREIIINRLKDENNEFIFVIHTHYLAPQSRELVNVVENTRHKYERFNIAAQCHESIIEKARNKYNARDFYDRYLLIK